MDHENPQIEYADGFEDLVAVLAEVKHSGSYCFSGPVAAPLPKILVGEVGTLSFPIPAEQCRRMVDTVAMKAPYGRGGETILDESVRKVWQVVPDQVALGGVGWEQTFFEILQRTARGLGYEETAIEAKLHKLLVYETGGFFSAHRDSEKAGGMFGTLVVALPSAHEGGCLCVRHLGEEAAIDLCNEDPGQLMVAAFYADCEHEVLPITSGYRVCLVFNLIQKRSRSDERYSAPDHRVPVRQSSEVLKEWAEGRHGDPEKLVWLLRHRYTSAGLSFHGLKGRDAAGASVLDAAAERAGCALHLGIVHVEESGWAEYNDAYYGSSHRYWEAAEEDGEEEDEFSVGEVCDGRYYIDSWRDRKDTPQSFGEIPMENGEALPPGALEGEEADEKHFTEATGNEGVSFERTYLRAACVLWPKDRTDEICLSAGVDAGLGLLEERVSATRRDKNSRKRGTVDALHTFLGKLLDRWNSDRTPGLRLKRLLAALVRANDPAIAEAVPTGFLAKYYTGAQNDELVRWLAVIGDGTAQHSASALLEANARCEPAACLDLWTRLADDGFAPTMLEAALSTLLDGMLRRPSAAKHQATAWSAVEDLKPPTLEPSLLVRFLVAINESPVENLLNRAVLTLADDLRTFDPEEILLPALEQLAHAVPTMPEGTVFVLWQSAATFFLERSDAPPVPPQDWAMPAKFAQNEFIMRELAAFARSGDQQEHRFRARKELRQIVHRAIEAHRLDMTHVTERRGSPYTLVCRKTLGSYEKACQRYRSDLAAIKRLAALPIAMCDPADALRQRLRTALGRFTDWTPASEPG